MPSYSPSSSFFNLVGTFPLISLHLQPYFAFICNCLLILPVPIAESEEIVFPCAIISTSWGFALLATAPISNPCSSWTGKSLALWTAISIDLSSKAFSIVSTKAPLPPKSVNFKSRLSSPNVDISTISHLWLVFFSIKFFIILVCIKANLLFLVPIFIFIIITYWQFALIFKTIVY